MPLQTTLIKVKPGFVEPGVVGRISEIILKEGVMAYPTDTFYGLGASAYSERAVQKIYLLKQRERGRPLSVVISGIDMAENVAALLPPAFWQLSQAFWPGPLTLVIKARPLFPPEMLGPGGSLALRLPDVPWLLDLVRLTNIPVTATSANISGEKEIDSGHEVVKAFMGKVDLIVDGGTTPGGLASTVVDLTADRPRILREGAVPREHLMRYL